MKMQADEVKGSIVHRVIRGKDRFYHQWRENGKTMSRYLKAAEVLPLRERIEAKKARKHDFSSALPGACPQNSPYVRGSRLAELAASVKGYKPRSQLKLLAAYLSDTDEGKTSMGKVMLLHGLPQTGKSVLLRQAIGTLPAEARKSAVYLSIPSGLERERLFADFRQLADDGVRYFFIDGLERSNSVISGIPALADTLAGSGRKVILAVSAPSPDIHGSGITVIDTTYIPFIDHELVTGSSDLSGYLTGNIRAPGGTIPPDSLPGLRALARRSLGEVLSGWARKHGHRLGTRVGNDIQKIARRLNETASDPPDAATLTELTASRLVATSEGESFILLPGVRHRLAVEQLEELLDDPIAAHLGAAERKIVRDSILWDADERTWADLLLYETIRARAKGSVSVFRVRFSAGGFDIVVADRDELTCELYDVKLSAERDERDLRDLTDQLKLDTVEHRYGIITAREIIYPGRGARHSSGVYYRTLHDYLTALSV